MESSLKEQTKEKMLHWKSRLEHFNLQMNLGASEAKDEFEHQKKELNIWLQDSQRRLEKLEAETKVNYKALRQKIDELILQTALGKADADDLMKEQERKISHGIHDVKHELNQLYEKSDQKSQEVIGELNERADDFHTRFDLFRVQFNLGLAEAKDYWTDKKKELTLKLHDLNIQLDQASDKAEHKWDDFSKEMSESWKHFKKAFD